MGRSLRAHLVFGYSLGGDEDGWKLRQAVGDYGDLDYEQLLDYVDPDEDEDVEEFAEQMAEKLRKLAIPDLQLHWHGGDSACVTVGFRVAHAEWGEAIMLEMEELLLRRFKEKWEAKLAEALTHLGITPTQREPEWLLLASYA